MKNIARTITIAISLNSCMSFGFTGRQGELNWSHNLEYFFILFKKNSETHIQNKISSHPILLLKYHLKWCSLDHNKSYVLNCDEKCSKNKKQWKKIQGLSEGVIKTHAGDSLLWSLPKNANGKIFKRKGGRKRHGCSKTFIISFIKLCSSNSINMHVHAQVKSCIELEFQWLGG